MRNEYENLRIRTLSDALARACEKVDQLEQQLREARRDEQKDTLLNYRHCYSHADK